MASIERSLGAERSVVQDTIRNFNLRNEKLKQLYSNDNHQLESPNCIGLNWLTSHYNDHRNINHIDGDLLIPEDIPISPIINEKNDTIDIKNSLIQQIDNIQMRLANVISLCAINNKHKLTEDIRDTYPKSKEKFQKTEKQILLKAPSINTLLLVDEFPYLSKEGDSEYIFLNRNLSHLSPDLSMYQHHSGIIENRQTEDNSYLQEELKCINSNHISSPEKITENLIIQKQIPNHVFKIKSPNVQFLTPNIKSPTNFTGKGLGYESNNEIFDISSITSSGSCSNSRLDSEVNEQSSYLQEHIPGNNYDKAIFSLTEVNLNKKVEELAEETKAKNRNLFYKTNIDVIQVANNFDDNKILHGNTTLSDRNLKTIEAQEESRNNEENKDEHLEKIIRSKYFEQNKYTDKYLEQMKLINEEILDFHNGNQRLISLHPEGNTATEFHANKGLHIVHNGSNSSVHSTNIENDDSQILNSIIKSSKIKKEVEEMYVKIVSELKNKVELDNSIVTEESIPSNKQNWFSSKLSKHSMGYLRWKSKSNRDDYYAQHFKSKLIQRALNEDVNISDPSLITTQKIKYGLKDIILELLEKKMGCYNGTENIENRINWHSKYIDEDKLFLKDYIKNQWPEYFGDLL
ncbi:hypothetical protein TBLA_0G01140 [Henningerozyma blattae CBS 6284]|uniref:Uncharacterized protein n=1 Tax=Henningerozyma blattae (strain ATCC 34711 / CBS 6284 / DSM 70876 / NBRC 10599 / NRRL Y-10934 / UCD 77-7) TaxID=1071380 RepID=I2H6Q8_HENB6|nr:hypothetical protein TBLA_0G01140 [Tetrapisispora blattae CBS 6284]CCH62060.1 hypothetical protein TBLA_0G01140 [Tetrapisispora blattae CBS 6284]